MVFYLIIIYYFLKLLPYYNIEFIFTIANKDQCYNVLLWHGIKINYFSNIFTFFVHFQYKKVLFTGIHSIKVYQKNMY